MDNRIYLINLYDYYGDLLTDKQKEYFEDYYFNNLTLAEIGENNNISRNAIHKSIKESEEKILFYEERLELYKKRNEILGLLKNIDEETLEKIKELI